MAGHSKWANIKFRKGKADAKRGKIFSRVAKEIISAVKTGGKDPKSNTRLRLAIQKGRDHNVPNDVIERNIKKAAGADQANYDELTYELYGHGGVGIILDIMTDNKNRTASEIRIATNKRGGTIASPGSVAFNFERKGIIQVNKNQGNEEKLFLAATEAGAEDFEVADEIFLITTEQSDLYAVKEAIEALGFPTDEVGLEMVPKTMVSCDQQTFDANIALIDWLEGIDDVDEVYHNMELEG